MSTDAVFVSNHAETVSPFDFQIDILKLNLTSAQSHVLAFFLEAWCAENCVGDWNVTQNKRELKVAIANDLDAVMFKLSDGYELLNHYNR